MPETTIVIPKPDDWHVHLRDGAMLRAVLPYTARSFVRAIVMPNLRPPVTTSKAVAAYRDQILALLPPGSGFTPLMTLYLTDATDADDLAQGHADGIVTAAKLYPANATTNAEHGVSDVKKIYPVLERMQKIGMPLLVHGETVGKDIDIFDREAVFIDRTLIPLRRDFPELKIVFEHITTEQAASYVAENGGKTLAATITPHHLHVNRNAMFAGGIRPHYYCLPVAKREQHRQALVKAATSGKPMFFLGTDTAPHADTAKESACGCAGIFCAPQALELYAQCFDDAGKIANFEIFASRNGPAFYGFPVNAEKVTLQKQTAPIEIAAPIETADGQCITPFVPPSPLMWKIV
ncbi:MAG: dihydroorotase [Alphaproteobacteria bacterium]|nr:dihydroorotase [Alphaproteobacteria bacterium]